MRAIAILVAAGPGTRLGAGVPKAFVPLAGEALYLHSLRALARASAIDAAVVVVPPARLDEARRAVADAVPALRTRVVAGGAERADSVRAGLEAAGDADVIAVHDAARPFVAARVVDEVVAAAAQHGAAISAVPAIDTVKMVDDDGVITATPDRARVWLAQTPQAFRADLLRRAHAQGGGVAATDDAVLVEMLGESVRVVAGDAGNRKITSAEDLRWAEWVLRQGEATR